VPDRPILVERADGRAVVTLNQPERMNPLDGATVTALRAALGQFEVDPDVRVVLFTGAGRAFSAGGDLDGYLTLYRRPDEFRAYLEDFFRLCEAIERSSRICLAVVNGYCVAGGLELMLACDLALAAEEARLGDGHLTYGQLPGAGGSQRLPRAIGAIRARHLILTGRLVDGREAERIGLVAECVARQGLMARAHALTDELLTRSPAGLRGAKYLVNRGLEGSLASGLQLELAYVHHYATTEPDATEGLLAFKEKRPPRFSAR